MGWIDGTPLNEFAGVFSLVAEDQDEPNPEALAIRWMQTICGALEVLHSNGLTHGDVSPRNLIVSGTSLVLTDYDFVTRIDQAPIAGGTISYCSPERAAKESAVPMDDLYALAASFFHVLFEKQPFRYGGELAKERGLNWESIDRSEYPVISDILDRATNADNQQRFASASEMLSAFKAAHQKEAEVEDTEPASKEAPNTGKVPDPAATKDQLPPNARTNRAGTKRTTSPMAEVTVAILPRFPLGQPRDPRTGLPIRARNLCGDSTRKVALVGNPKTAKCVWSSSAETQAMERPAGVLVFGSAAEIIVLVSAHRARSIKGDNTQ